jgi:phage-related protein
MALSIPIVSEFDGKGIDKAIKEFKQLETVGEKAQFAISKAAVPAAAAITAVAGALGLAAKAAAEDEQQQAILANTMQNVVGATDATVAATEDMISAMSRATGTADSELRPAFAALLVGTKNVSEATDALGIAQDIATATGTDLATVSDALAKAYAGNMKGLQALSPEMKGLIKDGADLDTVMMALSDNFGGATARSAGTAAGQFKILKNSVGEFQESLGALLLPVIMKVLPKLQMLADWAQANPEKFMNVAKAVTAVSVAVLAMNIAVNAHPLIAIGSALLTVAGYLVYAYNKFETFRDVVNGVFNAIMSTMQTFVNAFNSTLNVLIRAYNLLNFGTDVPSIPMITLPRMGGGGGSAVSGGGAAREGGTGSITPALPSMPSLPASIISGGGGGGGGGSTFERSPAQFTPASSAFQGVTTFGMAERIAARNAAPVTINVTGGISTSAEIGQSVLNSLLAYQRTNGPLDLMIAD